VVDVPVAEVSEMEAVRAARVEYEKAASRSAPRDAPDRTAHGGRVMRLRVGNGPCSWGTLEFAEASGEQVPFGRMLDELAETGYTGTELGDWGYMPTDSAC